LFVALVFGHFGMQVPREVMELGLLLFVYAVGLQAGPRFFRTFRRHGIQFVVIALAIAVTGGLATLVVARWLRLPSELASGLYTGALTCTPALAAAIDVVERVSPGASAAVSVGWSRLSDQHDLRGDLMRFCQPRCAATCAGMRRCPGRRRSPGWRPGSSASPIRTCTASASRRSTRTVWLRPTFPGSNGEQVFAATPDIFLQQGDVVMVVGAAGELDKLRLLFGEETTSGWI
jgi:putative transport protein